MCRSVKERFLGDRSKSIRGVRFELGGQGQGADVEVGVD